MAQLAHHVPGRLRLKLNPEVREPRVFAQYTELVRNLPGVLEVSTNDKSGSVVIRYDPSATTGRAVLERLNGKGPTLPHERRGETRAPIDGAMQQAVQAFGIAVGQALFNAAFRFSVERSVTALLRRR
jgi:hypothetical protein